MKLYSWDVSPYSARVRMQIYAKGLTDIAIEQPATYGTLKFYQDHPIGRIPFLEIDGEAMPESAVIAEYLEEVYPEPSLLGATPRESHGSLPDSGTIPRRQLTGRPIRA